MRFSPVLVACATLFVISSAAFAQTIPVTNDSEPSVISVGSQDEAASEPIVVGSADTKNLADQFAAKVQKRLNATPDVYEQYAQLASEQLDKASIKLERDQFVVVVDRNTNVQAALLYVMGPSGAVPVGATPVSTGIKGRRDHFITPIGVVANTLDNPSFRAMGTKNSNGFRGYGRKGMRVWDFGWTPAVKGWGTPEVRDIRFQMHATDPDSAEPHLGHPASEGCVRVSAGFNAFADQYGVLDADYLADEAQGNKLWVLPKVRVTTALAGRYLVVVDSNAATRPEWDAQVAH